ncbi:hypothetical protein Nepgr_007455 [Nepenthes gracilis]|uniref:Transmembrane protein n=1 Tax=Nepenthes gracilis TaxID=150966 RepID=A0AAD3S737_NEPGR|nr:hypothetical protein Nepgr_007455 [Nepenthes gracilis]
MQQSMHYLLSSSQFTPSCHPLASSSATFSLIPSLTFFYKPTAIHTVNAHLRTKLQPWMAQLPEPAAAEPSFTSPVEDGPIEITSDTSSIFATTDDPTPIQVATSVLLTGAIAVFLFRSIRRRAKRAKELKLRSSSAKKTLKDEALNSLKEIGVMSVEPGSPPSPVQALLGGVAAGVIALILYKFTTTIEAALSRQTISDNYSVRQITITIRTVINGLCYLATFVFGINSVGLFLYSGQLAMNSLTEGFAGNDTKTKEKKQPTLANSLSESETNEAEEVSSNESGQSPDVPR